MHMDVRNLNFSSLENMLVKKEAGEQRMLNCYRWPWKVDSV